MNIVIAKTHAQANAWFREQDIEELKYTNVTEDKKGERYMIVTNSEQIRGMSLIQHKDKVYALQGVDNKLVDTVIECYRTTGKPEVIEEQPVHKSPAALMLEKWDVYAAEIREAIANNKVLGLNKMESHNKDQSNMFALQRLRGTANYSIEIEI